MVAVDPEQAWFWNPRWQEKLRLANADIEAGRTTVYESGDAFLDSLG